MRGYWKYSKTEYDVPELKEALVGCKRCGNTWTEDIYTSSQLKSGLAASYDCCDNCITDKDHNDPNFGISSGPNK